MSALTFRIGSHARAALGAVTVLGTAGALLATGAAATARPSVAPTVTASLSKAAAAPQNRCHTVNLALSVVADTAARNHAAGMNHQGATIALRNTGRTTCVLRGYPGAAMVAATDGSLVAPAQVRRGSTTYAPDAGPRTITLKPGQSAYGELSWTSAPGRRESVPVGALVVTPANEHTYGMVALDTVLGGDGAIRATALTARPATLTS